MGARVSDGKTGNRNHRSNEGLYGSETTKGKREGERK